MFKNSKLFRSLFFILFLSIGMLAPSFVQVTAAADEATLEVNHALDKEVEYSGVEGGKVDGDWRHPHLAGEAAVDGDMTTRWSAAKEDDQWLTVDLEEEIALGKVLLHFHTTSPDYEIQISNDNENFESVVHEKDLRNDRITMDYDLTGESARYVRYKQNELSTHTNGKNYGSSIFLFEVYDETAFTDLEETNDKDRFVVGSFNIAGGLNPEIFEQSKQAHSHQIDIVGLQEVDNYTNRTRYDMLRSFASLRFPYYSYSKSIDYQDGEYGVGTVSKHEILEEDRAMFPIYQGLEDRSYQRVLIEKADKKIAFYNAHLSFENPYVRRRQMEILKERMMNDPAEYVFATGDFNILSESEYDLFTDEFNLANGHEGVWYDTFNGSEGQEQVRSIDNIIASKNLKIQNVGVDTEKLSDHYLLHAEFEFLEPDKEIKAEGKRIKSLIYNLPKASEITLDDKEQVEEVREAYEQLPVEGKRLVTSLSQLEARERKINELENNTNFSEVKSLIYNLPKASELTLDDKEQVEEVREKYEKLTEEAKKQVTSISQLEAREKRLRELVNK